MSAAEPASRLHGYIEACDLRRGRVSDPAQITRISKALEPLLDLGDRLGPWPETVPADIVGDDRP